MNILIMMSWGQTALGLGFFALAVWGLAHGQRFYATYFFLCSWWSYILVVDSLIFRRRGRSWLLTDWRQFPRLLRASVTSWLIFEVANFSLGNWRYLGVPTELGWRWLDYTLSFATVFPAVFLTRDLLDAFGLGAWEVPPCWRRNFQSWLAPLSLLGIFCLVAPFLWPRYTFPLIWLALIFLLEPFCYLSGRGSFLLAWERSESSRFFQLLLAGGICGLLWELWNYWAWARWIYVLPFFNWPKIFEMPLLGTLGFLPFAWECWLMYNAYTILEERWLSSPTARKWWLAGQVLFWLAVFAAIDRWTVVSFQS